MSAALLRKKSAIRKTGTDAEEASTSPAPAAPAPAAPSSIAPLKDTEDTGTPAPDTEAAVVLPQIRTDARAKDKDDGIPQLKNLDKKEVYDLATSMFLDCGDEKYIAAALSEHFGVDLDTNTVRQIRFQAAAEADRMENPQDRKKWIFRYSYLTTNNLVKEYMFIMRSQNFYEAKVELADEFFWLQQKFPRNKLWMALNEAVGRNNVPIDIVDELLEFRDTLMHVKQIIGASAKQKKTDPTMLLIELSEKTDQAYRGECKEDSIKAAVFASRFLDIEDGSIKPTDVKFLREYLKCSNFPDRSEEDSLMKLIEGADTLQKRSLIREAAAGDAVNLTFGELHQLVQEMRLGPVLKAEQLQRIADFAARKTKDSDMQNVLAKLKVVIEDHLSILEVAGLISKGELLKFRVQGVTSDELQEMLKMLNSLASMQEVQSYSAEAMNKASKPRIVETLVSRYTAKRFGV